MARGRRRSEPLPAQASFAWADAAKVLEGAPDGEVLYEAPELKRRGRGKAQAPPVAKGKTLGLPFGVRDADGHVLCWSCGAEIDEGRVVHAGPGDVRCPGCGAKLPFI